MVRIPNWQQLIQKIKYKMDLNSQHLQTILSTTICFVICYRFSRPLNERIESIVAIVRDKFNSYYKISYTVMPEEVLTEFSLF